MQLLHTMAVRFMGVLLSGEPTLKPGRPCGSIGGVSSALSRYQRSTPFLFHEHHVRIGKFVTEPILLGSQHGAPGSMVDRGPDPRSVRARASSSDIRCGHGSGKKHVT